jgi:hypothetical protein
MSIEGTVSLTCFDYSSKALHVLAHTVYSNRYALFLFFGRKRLYLRGH